jgi:exosortase K
LSNAETAAFNFLLQPTDKLVGLLTQSPGVYSERLGYYHEGLNILVDRSCSGFDFWMLSFMLLMLLTTIGIEKPIVGIFVVPVVLGVSYLLTILINVVRILTSIYVQQMADNFLPKRPHMFIHDAVGIVVELLYLLLIYYATTKLRNTYPNEKITKP